MKFIYYFLPEYLSTYPQLVAHRILSPYYSVSLDVSNEAHYLQSAKLVVFIAVTIGYHRDGRLQNSMVQGASLSLPRH